MLALLLECLPQQVALPTEGVDRNQKGRADDELLLVALPTEGVDRNMAVLGDQSHGTKSPSPRRAWIEIFAAMVCQHRAARRPPHGGRG